MILTMEVFMKYEERSAEELRESILAGVDESPMPASMYVMSMLSDVQYLLDCGDLDDARDFVNHIKIVVDERLAIKDAEGRHIKRKV